LKKHISIVLSITMLMFNLGFCFLSLHELFTLDISLFPLEFGGFFYSDIRLYVLSLILPILANIIFIFLFVFKRKFVLKWIYICTIMNIIFILSYRFAFDYF
jgi:hypothetical protein